MPTIVLTQYTDPTCTWSWGAEPIMRRVEARYGDQLAIEFVMGGLVEDFDTFTDDVNGISEPSQVAPHWETASRQHEMPVDAGHWREAPPRSSYPACIAVKAAASLGDRLGLRYLRRLREAAATERRNPEEREVLVSLAEDIGIDVDRFADSFDGGRAATAFAANRRRTRSRGVRGFPAFRVVGGEESTLLRGYLPFHVLERALLDVAPGLERRELPSVGAFVTTYGSVATQEVAEVYEWSTGKAEQVLGELAANGDVSRVERGNGTFWTPPGDADSGRLGTGELALGGGFEWDG